MESGGEDSKIVKSGGRRRPPAAGSGRKRGSLNRTTKTLKEALLASFDTLGGEAWLVSLAESDPKAYAGLLGRLIPQESRMDVDVESSTHTGGIIAIPAQFKSVQEWRRAFNPEQTEGRDHRRNEWMS